MASVVHKDDSSIDDEVAFLASQYGVTIEIAQAIFAAGVQKGRGSTNRANCGGSGHQGRFSFTDNISLEHLRREQADFAQEREWDQFHTPRNLALALVGEVGELCECFQVSPNSDSNRQLSTHYIIWLQLSLPFLCLKIFY